MKFTVARCEMLKRLDLTVYNDGAAIIGLNDYGDVEVRKALTPGYCAELKEEGEILGAAAFGPTPSIALLNLNDVLKREQEAEKAAKVIRFPAQAA